MSVSAGIVGLPNVGKSTLFNAITQAGAESANYPFCTIDPNVGVVQVPDYRLQDLADMVHPQRIIPTAYEFVDIAGLVKGASRGEGLGNQFLANIREVDAVAHVVRCFEDSNVTHVEGGIDPIRDIETIQLELILADLETVERRLERLQKLVKSGDKQAKQEQEVLLRIQDGLQAEKPAKNVDLDAEEKGMIMDLHLLTMKPVLYVTNVGEGEIGQTDENEYVHRVRDYAAQQGDQVVVISAKVESEIAELEGEDRDMFLAEIGIAESGLDRLVKATYDLLGLSTYFTAGEQEVRAWTIRNGTKAPQAAGIIHTDFERGFIRAEVIHHRDLMQAGSMAQGKEQGLLRLEGKDYVVQDGDVIHFRFNV